MRACSSTSCSVSVSSTLSQFPPKRIALSSMYAPATRLPVEYRSISSYSTSYFVSQSCSLYSVLMRSVSEYTEPSMRAVQITMR